MPFYDLSHFSKVVKSYQINSSAKFVARCFFGGVGIIIVFINK